MRGLPVSDRGYPVPWFVGWLDDAGEPQPRGQGTPEFRVMAPFAVEEAWRQKRCWICGEQTGKFVAFTLGSMCAVNRVNAEPPSHRDCADFAARACPFLVRPHAKRRPVNDIPGLEEGGRMAGKPILRNPGVAAVWVTERRRVRPYNANGILFAIGTPTELRWYREGRPATREEVWASIESGTPALQAEIDERETPEARALATDELAHALDRAKQLLPA